MSQNRSLIAQTPLLDRNLDVPWDSPGTRFTELRDPFARVAALALVVFAAAGPFVGCSNRSSGTESLRSAILQCTKDSTVLDSLATAPRTCGVDDDCPYGAYCDLVTQVCKYDCTADDACASGSVCDCDGRCVPSSGVPLSSTVAPPKLTTSPAFVALGGFAPDAWSPRQIDAILTTADARVAANDALHPRVVVTAGAGLDVTCAADGRQGSAYGPSCELTDWTFFQSGTQYRSVHTLWVRPQAGTTESKWELRLATRAATTTVAIAITNRAGGIVGIEGATTPQPREGSYVGTMVVSSTSDVVAEGARALHVPISALVRNDRVVLADPTRTLSVSGSLLIGAAGESRTTTWLTPAGAGGGQLLVTYSFATAPQWMELDGRVVGTFDETLLTNPSTVRHVSYQLQRVGALATTCDGGSCDGGAACEPTTRTCLPAGVLAPPASVDPSANGIANVDSQRWWSDEQALISTNARFAADGTNASEALMCADMDEGTAARTLVPTTLATSGDLACTGNKPPLAVGLEEHADLVRSGSLNAALTGPAMLKACLSDLGIAAPTSAIDPAASADVLRATFGKNPCISLARYYPALHQAAVGSAKTTSGVAERDRYGGTLFMHLLAQWLDVHSFVARESMQEQQLRPMLDGTPPPDVQTTLDRLEQGWDLVLAKENVDRLAAMSAAQLRNPDYRVAKRPIAYWAFGPNDVDQANHLIKDLVGNHPATVSNGNPNMPTQFTMADYWGWSAHAPWPTDSSSDYSVTFWISEAEPRYVGTIGQPGYSMVTRALRLSGSGETDDFAYYFRSLNGTQIWLTQFEEIAAGAAIAAGAPPGGPDVVTIAVNGNANTVRVYRHGAVPTGSFRVPAIIDSLDIHLPQGGWPDYGTAKMVGVAVWDSALGLQDHNQLVTAATQPYPGFALSPTLPTLPTGQDYEQNIGLPVKMVETAASHVAFLNQYLDDFTYQQYGQCDAKASARATALARLGKGLRYADAVEGVATGLYNAAAALPGGVDWEKRWQAAHDELNGLRARALQLAARVRDCANPLGISDQDLPLYFGDTTGPINAFFASSMYLASQWADPAIQGAAGSLTTVRDAWTQQKNSIIQDQVAADEAQRRVDALYTEYYQPIIDLCGLAGVEPKDVPAQFTDGGGVLTADNCFIARSSGCQDMAAKLLAKVNDSHARYTLGMMAGLASKMAFPSDIGGLLGGWSAATVSNGNVTANGKTVPVKRLYDGMGLVQKNMVPRRKNGAGGVTEDPDEPYGGGSLTPEDVQAAGKTAANTVGKDAPLPTPNNGDPELAIDPSCFHGQLGEQALAVLGAKQDVDIARASWQDTQQRYDLKSQYCAQLKGLDDGAQAALVAHAKEMRDLRDAKAITDDCAIALEHVSEAISGGSSSFGASSATEIAAGVTRIVSNELQHQMDNSEADYQVAAAKRSNDKEIMSCYHEADLSRVGITTAASQVTRAKTSAIASLVQIQNMRQRVTQLLFEGKAAIGREQGRTVASVAHHYWFGEKLELAKTQFAWAKRVTYLALRALEYEFQLVANTPNASNTASLRASVLGAKNASDLTTARMSLDAYRASARINGKQPEQETLVLRMAKDVLNLDDRSHVTTRSDGERYPTLAQRFSDLLLSQSSTIYNADGTPFGQAIRFSLSADIAPSRCAERLWRLNATVQTSKPVSDKKIAVVLYKRNTFSSTWCPDHGDGSDLQVNSYRPNAQLFLDSGGTAAVTPATAFTDAAVGAWLNVPLGDFSQDAYVEGSTTALGGRGLYGDYILVIPWSSLKNTKFGMEDITDILLRVDYGYVSNAPVVNGKKHNVEDDR